MNLFERMGLIEKNDSEFVGVVAQQDLPVEDVSANIDSSVNVVEEIYTQNSMADTSDSIYIIRDLINTLPPEMTTQKQQATVAGFLNVYKKSVNSLLLDAQNRIDTLYAARDRICSERGSEIEDAKNSIEELKSAIEAKNIIIKNSEEIIEATNKAVDDEVDIINGLVKFCEGMGEK